mgnify:FL=1
MKIAITGKMCSGKTTLANYICSKDSRFQIFSFGQKVKDIASDLFHMDPNIKNRTLLTSIGQKMREINPDVWANYILQQTKDINYCIIDDLRYQNEYELLKQNGWKIIQLQISKNLQEERIQQIYPSNYLDHFKNRTHLSELNQFNWNHGPPDLIIQSGEKKEIIQTIIDSFLS